MKDEGSLRYRRLWAASYFAFFLKLPNLLDADVLGELGSWHLISLSLSFLISKPKGLNQAY